MQRGLIRLAVVAVSAASLSAQAGEVCVACAEPAASYRCALEGADPSAIDGPGIQLLCIKELASRAGHKSCSIDRARPCNGPLMLVQRAPGVAPASGPETPAPSGDPAAIPDPGAPPATVEELA